MQGLCPRGSLTEGGLCPGGGSLSKRESLSKGVSDWGVSVQEGSLCPRRALCLEGILCSGGVSVWWGLCQGDLPYGIEWAVRILLERILV